MSEQQPKPSITFSSFADWCLHKDSLCEAARYTVEVVLKKAGTSDIYEANQILSSSNELDLYQNQISDITPLRSCAGLTSLNLSSNQISDITPLQSLTNLTSLNFSSNQISDLASLRSCAGLTYLDLYNNQISDLTPLQSLAGLTCLDLDNNQISDLTPLQSCAGLTHLYLGNNQISDLTPLQSLAGLTSLYLYNNQISDFTPLQSCASLTNLDVNFAPQQKTFIEAYHHSWETLGNSTASISRTQATIAVKNLYETLGLEAPEITFCSSPNEGLAQLQRSSIDNELLDRLDKQVKNALHPFSLIENWWRELEGLFVGWDRQLKEQLSAEFCGRYDSDSIVTAEYVVEAFALAELCVSGGIVLEPESQKLFEAVKQILAECGWIFLLDGICIVCDRPIKLSLDSEYRLHAEGESAIEFSDGYKLYSYHGVTLPKKYGAIHPENWQAEWILSERNAELRRVLIQGIGYDRICQELEATELDWYSYLDSLSREARHTVEVLLEATGTSNINEANQILSSKNELELSSNYISDITPLQSLTNLTSLNLCSTYISDLAPLQSLTNLTSLNLDENQISDITPLQSLTNLTSLNLDCNQISDITPLQSLTNLTSLNLDYNQISDITPLQSLTNLTSLSLSNNQISDLTPLQSCAGLTCLDVDNNQISDFTPLQSLTNLTSLSLSNNQISDLTSLQSCAGLTSLNLSNNQISDLTPLQSCAGLTSLNLSNNQISDLTPLQSLTNLTSLNLSNNQISDLTPLQSLTNLTSLILGNNQISDLTPLQSCAGLTDLYLSSNQISDLTPLQSCAGLTHLNLNNNQISDLTPLRSCAGLTDLLLSENQISDLTPLQSLTGLTWLNLNNNQISDLTPLLSCAGLTDLVLSENQISDLTPLQSLTGLTCLILDNNQISDLTPLQSLTNLTHLDLGNNQISDLTPLQSCAGLTYLDLDNNQISGITPLQSCAGLTYLDLDNNQISDLTPLQSLTGLTHLEVNFAPQQKTLIEAYHHSWGTLGNSTASISRAQATIAVKNLYETLGLEAPEITFCSSPNEGFAQLNILKMWIDIELMGRLRERVKNALHPFSLTSWWRELEGLFVGWDRQLNAQLFGDLYCYEDCLYWIATTTYVVEDFALAEFCVSGLGIVLEPESQKLFEAVKQLLTECGWIFPLDGICIVCDRPIKLLLDREYRLHAEGSSAIEFADGYKLYSYHGVTLPKKYGAIHPHNWQAKWILSENNAEIRRVLIQGIGYDRICQELQAIQLDSWQEYSLLKIDNADIEPIHLLKMNCPSTGFIHALRVPPDVRSAKEAIRWVNWDIDPEEFSVQT